MAYLEESLYKELGNLLRTAREKSGLTLAEIANKMEVTPMTIQRYEKGERKINTEKIRLLCKFYSVNPEELMQNAVNNSDLTNAKYPSSNKFNISEDILAVVDLMLHTDSETQRYIYTLVRDYLKCSVRDQSRINSVAYMIAERTLADKVKPLKKSEDIIKDIIDIDLAK